MNTLGKNFLYNVSYQLLLLVLPLITAPYISRILGAEGIGIYSYTNSIAYNFLLFAMLGMSNLGNRSIAERRNSRHEVSQVFWDLYCIQFSCFIVIIILYLAFVLCFVKHYKFISLLEILYILSGLFDISWLYFGLEKFKLTVLKNAVIKIFSVLCIFIFVKKPSDLWIYTLIMSSSFLISQLYLWFHLNKYISFAFPKASNMKKYIKPLIILFIPVVSYSIYKVMDKIMLGNMSTMMQVGYYENALKIVNIPLGIISALGTVMLPRMAALISSNNFLVVDEYIRISIKFVTLLASAICFGLISISSNLAPTYFGIEYMETSSLIVILSSTCFFVAWANVGRTQYLIPKKIDNIYLLSTISGAVVNLTVNLILIPRYAAKGAAFGTVLAEFSIMFVQIFLLRKEIRIYKYIYDAKGYLLIGGCMAILIKILTLTLPYGWSFLMIEILAGVLIFSFFLYIYMKFTKDEFLKYIKK